MCSRNLSFICFHKLTCNSWLNFIAKNIFCATVTLRIKWPWPPQNFCNAISMWNNSWVKLSRKFSSRSWLQNNQVLGEVTKSTRAAQRRYSFGRPSVAFKRWSLVRSHFLKLLLHFCFSKLALKLAHFKAPFVRKKNIFWEIVFLANLSGVFSGKALEKWGSTNYALRT